MSVSEGRAPIGKGRLRRLLPSIFVVSFFAVIMVACERDVSDAPEEPEAVETPAPEADEEEISLAAVCPDPIIIQTSWVPQPDRAVFYGLIGPGGEIDVDAGAYRGPALADPEVTVEVRFGGPHVGFQGPHTLMYLDRDILIGDQNLDTMIRTHKEFPTVGVFTTVQRFPSIFMFDPATYDFDSVTDIKDSGATVLVSPGETFSEGLVGIGALNAEQIDDSYDFAPDRFVAAEGKLVQQGFATNEPYLYENVIEAWGKPTDYVYVYDAGYPNLGPVATMRQDALTEEADCLAVLVPLLQQVLVDYVNNPDQLNDALIEMSEAIGSSTPLTKGLTEYSVNTMLNDGLVDDGPSGYTGEFVPERVQELINIVIPIFEEQGLDTFDPNVKVSDIVTNEFLDEAISLSD